MPVSTDTLVRLLLRYVQALKRHAAFLRVPLRALVLGASYGVRVRAPHAFVMSFLFDRNSTLRDTVKKVSLSAFQHAKHLAYFAFIYKLCMWILKPYAGKPSAAIAGAVGGLIVWRKHSAINQQITFYLAIRVLYSTFRLLANKDVKPFSKYSFPSVYPVMAVVVWAAVMYLFENEPGMLQPSLLHSMNEIYTQAETSAGNFLSTWMPTPATIAVFLQVVLSAASWEDVMRLLRLT